jgi:hypothetical protein
MTRGGSKVFARNSHLCVDKHFRTQFNAHLNEPISRYSLSGRAKEGNIVQGHESSIEVSRSENFNGENGRLFVPGAENILKLLQGSRARRAVTSTFPW